MKNFHQKLSSLILLFRTKDVSKLIKFFHNKESHLDCKKSIYCILQLNVYEHYNPCIHLQYDCVPSFISIDGLFGEKSYNPIFYFWTSMILMQMGKNISLKLSKCSYNIRCSSLTIWTFKIFYKQYIDGKWFLIILNKINI